MNTIAGAARRYPWLLATLSVAAVAGILALTPAAGLVPWLVGGAALTVAAWQAVGMVRDLLGGHAGIDILAIIAIVAAVSVGEPWAALIVALMLTGGEALEDYAEQRSRRELTALLARAPQRAHLLRDGDTREVAVAEVRPRDLLLVRPGELVPVDAVLVDAAAQFDESSLTGESLPVERVAGEAVPSGAVNGQLAVRMRARATADDSQFQRIVRLVEEASQNQSRVIRLADRYAVPFTAFALGVAGLAWALSGDAGRFAEVLVVATPCPLLIAAPVAFLGGMSRSARAGIIVKGSATLEQLARVRAVAFDKTGTLTSGKPELERIETGEPGGDPGRVLRLAASAEVYSSHVLAAAVVAAAKAAGHALGEVSEAEEVATNGVRAIVEGEEVLVGKAAWVGANAAGARPVALAPGELAIHVAVGGRVAGALIMRDQLRPEAAATVASLRAQGAERLLLVTGDVAATAEPIAASLGITEVHASCLPEDKVRIVAGAAERPILMVGDGLNDAPVLAAADIGFAMGARGSTAASESADVVNLADDLGRVALAVRFGRETVRVALQSIWLGIAISVALMLVAAGGFLPAIVGAWLQEGVDLVAILWALRALGPRSERIPGARGRGGSATAGSR